MVCTSVFLLSKLRFLLKEIPFSIFNTLNTLAPGGKDFKKRTLFDKVKYLPPIFTNFQMQ